LGLYRLRRSSCSTMATLSHRLASTPRSPDRYSIQRSNRLMTSTDIQHLKTELDKWQNAVIHSRSTIKYLEERSEVKTARIRELECQVKEVGRKPRATKNQPKLRCTNSGPT